MRQQEIEQRKAINRPSRGQRPRVLQAAYRSIASAIGSKRAITPAADWLVDNFHAVDKQIRDIGDDLPRGYYRQLPKLAEGPLEGYPRVFGLAWALLPTPTAVLKEMAAKSLEFRHSRQRSFQAFECINGSNPSEIASCKH
jgi:hypothetical protein